MTTHLEDLKVSGVYRDTDGSWVYRYGALCGIRFYGGNPEHTLVNPLITKHSELNCVKCMAIQDKAKRK